MDASELEQAIPHLAFEVYHFRSYLRLYNEAVELKGRWPVTRQAIQYALLLHLRLLLAFFYKRPILDDCCVSHFIEKFPEFSTAFHSKHLSGTAADQATTALEHLNKRLAHLTATRWIVRAPDMSYYLTFCDRMNELVQTFETALPSHLQSAYRAEMGRWARIHPVSERLDA